MSTKLRTHGKGVVVWILLGVLVLGLGGFGISNFSGGMRKIGKVGSTDISTGDYARTLRQQLAQAEQQLGKPLSMEEAKSYGLPQQVQAQLFSEAALIEEARRLGLSIGDKPVAAEITAAPVFQSSTGTFDRKTYQMVLRQEGYTEAEFETRVRDDIVRQTFSGLLTGGAEPAATELSAYTDYVTETRPFAFVEVTSGDLKAQPGTPTDDQLQAYYKAHPKAFTAPETREITYDALTPEMLGDGIEIDDATLKAAYQQHLSEYQQPERRRVDRLVFPDEKTAEAAKAELDAGKTDFTALAKSRGLDLKDIDLGEVSKDELGAAGEAVFALKKPGIAGPVTTDLGPALFMMNGIVPAEETSFEEAKPDLEAEAKLDKARRMISDMSSDLADQLASGATLEDLAKASKMQLGHISMSAETQDGLAAYEAFRTAANKAKMDDFPEIENLDDGGIFALRLDRVTPAAVIPFEKVKDKVAKAWQKAEAIRLKTERAQEIVANVAKGADLRAAGLPVTNVAPTARGAFVEDVPAQVVQTAFASDPGKAGIARDGDRVFVTVPGQTQSADPTDPDVKLIRDKLKTQLSRALARDLGVYYTTAVETELGVSLDTAAINAVQAQMR